MMHVLEKKKVIFLGWVLFRIQAAWVWKLPDKVEPNQMAFWRQSLAVAFCVCMPASPCTQGQACSVWRPFHGVLFWRLSCTAPDLVATTATLGLGTLRACPAQLCLQDLLLFSHLVFCHSVNARAFLTLPEPNSAQQGEQKLL